jgi:hypothetical protein
MSALRDAHVHVFHTSFQCLVLGLGSFRVAFWPCSSTLEPHREETSVGLVQAEITHVLFDS